MPSRKILNIYIVQAIDLTGKSLETMVKGFGHIIVGVSRKPNIAYELIVNLNVDLLLLEIDLDKSSEAIHLANQIKENLSIPIVYITSIDDFALMEQLIKTEPFGYLMYPYSRSALRATISIAFNKFKTLNQSILIEPSKINFAYVNEGSFKKKLLFDHVLYIESDGNYVEYHTPNKIYRERSKLKDIEKVVSFQRFLRINKGLLINLSKATGYNNVHVFIGELSFPVSRLHRKNIKDYFRLVQV